jgi:hypothetical protein
MPTAAHGPLGTLAVALYCASVLAAALSLPLPCSCARAMPMALIHSLGYLKMDLPGGWGGGGGGQQGQGGRGSASRQARGQTCGHAAVASSRCVYGQSQQLRACNMLHQ